MQPTVLRSKRACAVTLTCSGKALLRKIKKAVVSESGTIELFTLKKYQEPDFEPFYDLKEFFRLAFKDFDTIIAVMSTGIVIREISDLLIHKSIDPGILVLDQNGDFVISLLSGHLGNANQNTVLLAKALGAQPVLTTASDNLKKQSVDAYADKQSLYIKNFKAAKEITALILRERPVAMIGFDEKITGCVELLNPNEVSDKRLETFEGLLIHSDMQLSCEFKKSCCILYPKDLTLGIGMRRNQSFDTVYNVLEEYCRKYHIDIRAIKKVSTISLKKNEPALEELIFRLDIDKEIISEHDILKVQEQFSGSDFVEKITGLRSVSEPCGYISSGGGEQVAPLFKKNGVTLSLWKNANE